MAAELGCPPLHAASCPARKEAAAAMQSQRPLPDVLLFSEPTVERIQKVCATPFVPPRGGWGGLSFLVELRGETSRCRSNAREASALKPPPETNRQPLATTSRSAVMNLRLAASLQGRLPFHQGKNFVNRSPPARQLRQLLKLVEVDELNTRSNRSAPKAAAQAPAGFSLSGRSSRGCRAGRGRAEHRPLR